MGCIEDDRNSVYNKHACRSNNKILSGLKSFEKSIFLAGQSRKWSVWEKIESCCANVCLSRDRELVLTDGVSEGNCQHRKGKVSRSSLGVVLSCTEKLQFSVYYRSMTIINDTWHLIIWLTSGIGNKLNAWKLVWKTQWWEVTSLYSSLK